MRPCKRPNGTSADRSRIRKNLIPELGELCMKDISREVLQTFVARKRKTLSPKSVRNLIALLGEMWVQAKADSYTPDRPVRQSGPSGHRAHQRALSLVGRDEASHRHRGGTLQDVLLLLDSGRDRNPVRRGRRPNDTQPHARPRCDQDHAEGLAREDRNGEVEEGQSSLLDFSAARGASSRIPSQLATEPARSATCHEQRNETFPDLAKAIPLGGNKLGNIPSFPMFPQPISSDQPEQPSAGNTSGRSSYRLSRRTPDPR
jgi:hypothetical protein